MIEKILSKIFPKTLNKIKIKSFNSGLAKQKEYISLNNSSNLKAEIENFKRIGALIFISNDWINPIIGEIIDFKQEDTIIYTVYDYLTKTTVKTSIQPHAFSIQKLKTISKIKNALESETTILRQLKMKDF